MDRLEVRPPVRTRPEQPGSSIPVWVKSSSRVLVLTLEEGKKMNPFQVVEALAKFGTTTRVYRHSASKLDVTMSSEEETYSLLSAKSLSYSGEGGTLVSIPITVTLHPTKNSDAGVFLIGSSLGQQNRTY